MTVQANGATVTETVIHEVRPKRSRLSRPGSGERRVMGVPARMPEDRAQQVVARVFARRERHRRRPLPLRIAVALAGFVLLALAAVLVLLPEVGLPALFGALALLALEFDWAARLLGGAVRLAERVRGRFVSLPTLTRLAVIAIPVLIVVTAVALVTGLGVSPI
jgi:hypothetical protein